MKENHGLLLYKTDPYEYEATIGLVLNDRERNILPLIGRSDCPIKPILNF